MVARAGGTLSLWSAGDTDDVVGCGMDVRVGSWMNDAAGRKLDDSRRKGWYQGLGSPYNNRDDVAALRGCGPGASASGHVVQLDAISGYLFLSERPRRLLAARPSSERTIQ